MNTHSELKETMLKNGFDWGYLKVEDLQNRTILFKMLCESIEVIKIKN